MRAGTDIQKVFEVLATRGIGIGAAGVHAGYAETSPVVANDTPENKAKNRRIEITLVPNLDDLPPIDEALKDNKEGTTAAP